MAKNKIQWTMVDIENEKTWPPNAEQWQCDTEAGPSKWLVPASTNTLIKRGRHWWQWGQGAPALAHGDKWAVIE